MLHFWKIYALNLLLMRLKELLLHKGSIYWMNIATCFDDDYMKRYAYLQKFCHTLIALFSTFFSGSGNLKYLHVWFSFVCVQSAAKQETMIKTGKKIIEGIATAHWLLYKTVHASLSRSASLVAHWPLRTQCTNIFCHSSGLRLNASATKLWSLNKLRIVWAK